MSRVQLALNVDDLEAAVDFYSKLLATPPAKRRDGYANFAIAEPALKLVLVEQPGRGGPSTTSASRSRAPSCSGRRRPASQARAWPPSSRTACRVATPVRTRFG